jgi:hypothetical protein
MWGVEGGGGIMSTSAIAKAYYEKSKLLLAEPVGRKVRLGAVGYLDKGQWVPVSDTKSMFGIDLARDAGTTNPTNFAVDSGKGFEAKFYAKGKVSDLFPNVPEANARLEMSFGAKNSFVVSVADPTVVTAASLADLLDAIRYAYHCRRQLPEGRRWDKKYVVVFGIGSMASFVAMSSEQKNAKAAIFGSGKLGPPKSPADVRVGMSFSYQKEELDKLTIAPGNGIAFQGLRLNPSMFSRWDHEDGDVLRALRAAGRQPPVPKRRPASFADWIASHDLSVGQVKLDLIDANGVAAMSGTATQVLREGQQRARSVSKR